MKGLKILPGAAGIIALTATMGFVDGQREREAESYARERMVIVRPYSETASAGKSSGGEFMIRPDTAAYLVEIKRGDTSKKVLVDALTGRILAS